MLAPMPRLWLSLALWAAACQGAPRPTEPPTRLVATHLGLTLELPASFHPTLERDDAVVFAGPQGSDDYFTTLALQSQPGTALLSAVLADTYAEVPGASFVAVTPALVGDCFGLRYLVSFTAHEQPRLRAGAVFAHDGRIFDLSYTATAELFPRGVPAFETALDGLGTLGAGGLWQL